MSEALPFVAALPLRESRRDGDSDGNAEMGMCWWQQVGGLENVRVSRRFKDHPNNPINLIRASDDIQ